MFLIRAQEYFFESYHFKKQTSLFKKFLYVLIIVKCIYWLCFFDLLFGEHSIIYVRPYTSGSIKDLAFILLNHGGIYLNMIFVLLAFIFSSILLFTKSTYIVEFAIWFLVLNVHNHIYSTLSGGDHLLSQLLFFNIFLCSAIPGEGISKIRNLLHNFATTAVITQVCLVYFLSALAKLGDSAWLSGSATGIIAGVNHFSNGSRYEWPGPVYVFLNYFVMFYQLLFPALALIKRTKFLFLSIGIVMHLYIAFVTGLPGFAAVMILGYVYFWPMKPENVKN